MLLRGGGRGRGGGGLLLRTDTAGCSDDNGRSCCRSGGGATGGLSPIGGRSDSGPGGLSGGGPLGLSGRGLLTPLAGLQAGSALVSDGFSGGAGGGTIGRSGNGGLSPMLPGDRSRHRVSSLLVDECTAASGAGVMTFSWEGTTPGGIGAGFLARRLGRGLGVALLGLQQMTLLTQMSRSASSARVREKVGIECRQFESETGKCVELVESALEYL